MKAQALETIGVAEFFDEELIRTEAEELAESLLAMGYYDMPPEWQEWVRSRVIRALWPPSESFAADCADYADGRQQK